MADERFTDVIPPESREDPMRFVPMPPNQHDRDKPFERPTGRTTRTGTPMARELSPERLERMRKWSERGGGAGPPTDER